MIKESLLAARVGQSVYKRVSVLAQRDRVNSLRCVITEAAQRGLMKDGEQSTER